MCAHLLSAHRLVVAREAPPRQQALAVRLSLEAGEGVGHGGDDAWHPHKLSKETPMPLQAKIGLMRPKGFFFLPNFLCAPSRGDVTRAVKPEEDTRGN